MHPITSLSTKSITIPRNGYLKMGGSSDTQVYFIKSGSVKIYVLDQEEEQIIRFGYPNNLVVALDSFFTGKPSGLFIQAIKKTTVRIITRQQLDTWLEEEGNRQLWMEILQELVVQQLEREVDILTGSPRERYFRVLQRSPQLFQEIPLRHIANYLRMSPETLSRLRKS